MTALGQPIDYLIVVAYFVGILGFGAYFGRFTKSTRDFFFGGQRFSWWLIAASLVATGIGSYSFIKYAQAGYLRGMSSTMTYLNDWFIIPLFMFGWLPIIYFARIKSVPEYFQRRFDEKTRIVATIFTLLYLVGYIGLNFYLLGTALKALLGIPISVSVPVVALISAIYVTLGGQTAVIFTDLIQGLFLYLAGAILLFLGLSYVGGFGEWWSNLDLAHRLPLPGFNRPPDFNFSAIFWGEGIAGTIAFTFINQGFIMRYLAAKSVTEGRKCLTFNTLILMPISAIVVGNVGWIAASMLAKGMTVTLADGSAVRLSQIDPKEVFVLVANVIARPGIFGFVIAALTAALMSTIDTLINACAAISIFDVYRPYIKKDASDKHYLKASRVASVLATALGLLLVPVFAGPESIFAAHYAFVSMVTPPMAVAILLGVTWKRFTPKAAFWSMIIGGVLILLSVFFPVLIKPFAWTHNISPEGGYKYFRAVYGVVVVGALAVIISRFTKPKPESELVGLTFETIQKAKELFKGGKPNEEPGQKLVRPMRIQKGSEKEIYLTQNDMNLLEAREGDLLYIADGRRWLGGLRSLHVKAGKPHDQDELVLVPEPVAKEGNLLRHRKVRIEKIM
ncbi:MAG: hypothetical protein AMJ46_03545 [Latescibacteria bacterium DG_63]|nr:MAG: hypothetical protein AMJ46_03545 [Latescibacteria bacterium DG_63]